MSTNRVGFTWKKYSFLFIIYLEILDDIQECLSLEEIPNYFNFLENESFFTNNLPFSIA